jgi:hypothetical protein
MAHAQQLADLIRNEDQTSKWGVKLKTDTQGLPLEPLDVIDIALPATPAWQAKQFRVESTTLQASEYNAAPSPPPSPELF